MIRPSYYIDKKGSLYKVATERKWNAYIFDCAKRLERAEKKGNFIEDIEKTITVIKLLKSEQKPLFWIRKKLLMLTSQSDIAGLFIVYVNREWDSFVLEIIHELEIGEYDKAIEACIRYQNNAF